jgi:succinate-acetate transporter protein
MARPYHPDSVRSETVPRQDGRSESARPNPAITPVVADPGPLGMAALALTLFLFASKQAGWMGHDAPAGNAGDIWISMGLIYGGLAQFMAGMWEFRNRNTFAATAFSSFGALWIGYAILYFFHPAYVSAYSGANYNIVMSFFFFPWVIFAAYMTFAALRTNAAVAATFLAMTLTLLFFWLGFKNNNAPGEGLRMVGGWFGIVTALCAWYASAAGVVNSTWGRRLLPVFPLGQMIDRYERRDRTSRSEHRNHRGYDRHDGSDGYSRSTEYERSSRSDGYDGSDGYDRSGQEQTPIHR